MKINYKHTNGTRSTITLDEKLLKVWGLTLFQPVTGEKMIEAIQNEKIPEALKVHRRLRRTLTKQVEHLLLDDIEKGLLEAHRTGFDLMPTD